MAIVDTRRLYPVIEISGPYRAEAAEVHRAGADILRILDWGSSEWKINLKLSNNDLHFVVVRFKNICIKRGFPFD